ncbi:hypothetical protein L0337_24450 [candidate division KSB1 bacterium]|nr:hypothetical protein [candidate division KSB1 bacterium]
MSAVWEIWRIKLWRLRAGKSWNHAFPYMQIFTRSLSWLAICVGLLVIYPFSPADAAGDQFAASREILLVTGINELLPAGKQRHRIKPRRNFALAKLDIYQARR